MTDTNQQQQQAPEVAKPEHVPDKFWNAETKVVNYEAWANSTRELEQKFHSQQQAKPDEKKTEAKPDVAPKQEQQQEQPTGIQAAMARATEELANGGTLTEDTYKAFEAVGLTRDVVDAHAEGVMAIQSAIQAEVHAVVGDDAGWNTLSEWAQANLTADEQKTFNDKLGKRGTMKAALTELKAKYEEAMGTDGQKSTANPNGSSDIKPYASKEEMMAAVKSAEYKTSATFRDNHARRIIASEKNGINVFK